jgi:hypothetical protein
MKHPDQIHRALSGARPEASCFSLEFDLHGGRLFVNLSFADFLHSRAKFTTSRLFGILPKTQVDPDRSMSGKLCR